MLNVRTFNAIVKRAFSSSNVRLDRHVAIIGSGPAGFYTAQGLFHADNTTTHVHMFDKQPVPGGLVRYGVAPDHPSVKNVLTTFSQIASHENYTFFGNVEMGVDFTIPVLRKSYDAIVLAYGAGAERKLNIPGENAKGVHESGNFVGWYNGRPTWVKPEFSALSAIVIGHGNVAADIARTLSAPTEQLKSTFCKDAVSALSTSRIKNVYLVGMLGPLQASLTMDELQELLHLPGVAVQFDPAHFEGVQDRLGRLPRQRRQLMEVMLRHIDHQMSPQSIPPNMRSLKFEFFKVARAVVTSPTNAVTGVKFAPTTLVDPEDISTAAKVNIMNGRDLTIEAGLVVKSIGYRGICVDPLLPFDETTGKIINEHGRVQGLPGVYAAGWIGCGAVGMIADMAINASRVAEVIANDFQNTVASKVEETEKGLTRDVLVQKLEAKHAAGWAGMTETEQRFGELLLGGKKRTGKKQQY